MGEVRAQDLVALAQAGEGRAQALGVDLGAELHDERHVVPHRALVLALLDEEPPLLRRHRVARRRTAGRAGRRVVHRRSRRGGLPLPADQARQLRDAAGAEDVRGPHAAGVRRTDPFRERARGQRVHAEVVEVVERADGAVAQYVAAELDELALQAVARGDGVAGRAGQPRSIGQAGAVELAVGVQREGVDRHEVSGHQVTREAPRTATGAAPGGPWGRPG